MTERETAAKQITEDNIRYFNSTRRKGKLSIVSRGDLYDLCKDNKRILAELPIEYISAAIVAIINYERKDWC